MRFVVIVEKELVSPRIYLILAFTRVEARLKNRKAILFVQQAETRALKRESLKAPAQHLCDHAIQQITSSLFFLAMSGTRSSTAAAAAAAVPNFKVTNQYAVNMDPSTTEGSKLLREFTNAKHADDDDKRLVVTTENAKEVQDFFELRADAFAWGTIISAVAMEYGIDAGNVTVTKRGSIFTEPHLKLDHLQSQASMLWGRVSTPADQADIDALRVPDEFKSRTLTDNRDAAQVATYFQRIRGAIADCILNTVDKDTVEKLSQRLRQRRKSF